MVRKSPSPSPSPSPKPNPNPNPNPNPDPSPVHAAQADMVRKSLGWSGAELNTKMPAGMIAAQPGTEVEWLLTEASAAELPAL